MPSKPKVASFRRRVSMVFFMFIAGVLSWRAMDLQFTNREFLQDHGTARYLRTIESRAQRGMIVDRQGVPLAISVPVDSVWAEPRTFAREKARWPEVAKILGTTPGHLQALVEPRMEKNFVYLKRQITPTVAASLKKAAVPGVRLTEEQKRFYPEAEVTAHLIGFTNVDDKGQEGIELSFEKTLRASAGANQVIKDRLGRVVEHVKSVRPALPGDDVKLSIDRRIQYIAYRELKAAVVGHKAVAGTMVVLDTRTGEILALVNQPSLNPNNRENLRGDYYRNRAITDVFEPGSTIKPITIAAALESGKFSSDSVLDTGPGTFKVGRHKITDAKNFGRLTVSGVIEKSSNVGASKIALSLDSNALWKMFRDVGFTDQTGVRLHGESVGRLDAPANWQDIEKATLAFGYGVSVNALQLARAYTVFANDGLLKPVSITPVKGQIESRRVLKPSTAKAVREMLQRVTTMGTGKAARVEGYLVAGKTGTVHKSTREGYAEDRYLSLFAGMIPASDPRLVAVVMIDEPRVGGHYGGLVAAPVFASVMREAVRIFNVPPDDLAEPQSTGGRLRVAEQPPERQQVIR
ncbi:MAG: peptidoglycan D,D-transpeptidase FtsI family protein [Gammaproteobacteria bacterium]